jgi:hypothetical protein
VRRTFFLWLVLRIVLVGLGLALPAGGAGLVAAAGGPRIAITPFGFLGLTGLTCGLLLLDARATGEDILIANAGVSRLHVIAVSTALVVALETILYVALS